MADKDWIAHAVQVGVIPDRNDTGVGSEIAKIAEEEYGISTPARMPKSEGEESIKSSKKE